AVPAASRGTISNSTSFVVALPTHSETPSCLGLALAYSIDKRCFPALSVVIDQVPGTPRPSGPPNRSVARSVVTVSLASGCQVQLALGASVTGGDGTGNSRR